MGENLIPWLLFQITLHVLLKWHCHCKLGELTTYWLYFCSVGRNGDVSSIFICLIGQDTSAYISLYINSLFLFFQGSVDVRHKREGGTFTQYESTGTSMELLGLLFSVSWLKLVTLHDRIIRSSMYKLFSTSFTKLSPNIPHAVLKEVRGDHAFIR